MRKTLFLKHELKAIFRSNDLSFCMYLHSMKAKQSKEYIGSVSFVARYVEERMILTMLCRTCMQG
jgi:hypothetical protein